MLLYSFGYFEFSSFTIQFFQQLITFETILTPYFNFCFSSWNSRYIINFRCCINNMLVLKENFFQSFLIYRFRKTLKLKSYTLCLLFFNDFWRLNFGSLSLIFRMFLKLLIFFRFFEYSWVCLRRRFPLLLLVENNGVIKILTEVNWNIFWSYWLGLLLLLSSLRFIDLVLLLSLLTSLLMISS